jgi:NAD-dependent dihydropyrimidine dehydrogenase PreA subunit
MAKRNIITIDSDKCTGCSLCIPNCPEGAIQIIDGKARLVSDLMCDGLGACLGHCPEGAITILEREAEAYDERKVMDKIVKHGVTTIRAHLAHLKEHGQTEYYGQAVTYLREHQIAITEDETSTQGSTPSLCGCAGAQTQVFERNEAETAVTGTQPSQLTHWPIQLHLISPVAPHFKNADMMLAADCTAYAVGSFHETFLRGRKLIIACPKLDAGQDVYLEKLTALIEEASIHTLTVVIMQVPCCGGLLHVAQQAAEQATRDLPIRLVVVSLQGAILKDETVTVHRGSRVSMQPPPTYPNNAGNSPGPTSDVQPVPSPSNPRGYSILQAIWWSVRQTRKLLRLTRSSMSHI